MVVVRWKPYFTFATTIYGLLAALFGSIPTLSLVMRVLSYWNWRIHLADLPQQLLDEYQRLRTAALEPIVSFIQLRFSLPEWLVNFLNSWAADLAMIYMLFVLSFVRGSMVDRRFDRINFNRDPELFEQRLRAAALLHGRDPEKLICDVEAGLEKGILGWFRFQRRIWIGSLQWPLVMKRNLIQLQRGISPELASSRIFMWSLMLACSLLGVIVYLLLSLVANH